MNSELVEIRKHLRQNFHSAKLPYDELILRRNFRTAKYLYGEVSYANILAAIFAYGEISLRQNFLTAKFLTAKFPTAKFPSAPHNGVFVGGVCKSVAHAANCAEASAFTFVAK